MPDTEIKLSISAQTENAKRGISEFSAHLSASITQTVEDSTTRWQELGSAIADEFRKAENEAHDRLEETKSHVDKAKTHSVCWAR